MSGGTGSLVRKVRDMLLDGRNVVAVCANGDRVLSSGEALAADLYECRRQVVSLACDASSAGDIVRAVAQELAPAAALPAGARDLFPLLADIDVLILTSPNGRHTEPHLQFVAAWAEAQRAAPSAVAGPHLCMIGWGQPDTVGFPGTDVNLAHVWAFNFGDAAAETAVRADEKSRHLDDAMEREWARRTLVALAGDDAGLVDTLAPLCCGTWGDLLLALQADGAARGWTRDGVEEVIAKLPGLRQTRALFGPTEPPAALRRHWAEGMLLWRPAGGLEMHSSALAVAVRVSELQHRLWRVQIAWLMPIIDGFRRRVCHYLVETSPGWHRRVECDEGDRERLEASPLNAELGVLLVHLVRSGTKGRIPQLLELVAALKDARNDLAHYRTVSLAQVQAITGTAQIMKDVQEVFL